MAKILLIDDELTMVQMIAEILRVEGHEVFPFTNGDDALQKIESIGPELVVSDLYLEKHRALGLEIL
ncbi:MAG: response regulator, partial [Verrucomicrobia bacterium]|nr:response regulator [Verrucomicrobiota bacterium]